MRVTENEKILILDSRGEDYDKQTMEKLIRMELDDVYSYDSNEIRRFMKEIVAEYDFKDKSSFNNDVSKLVN